MRKTPKRDDTNPAPPAEAGSDPDRVALGWARAERGTAGRLLRAIKRQGLRAWRASGRVLGRGGAALKAHGHERLRHLGLEDPARALGLLRRLPAGRFRAEAEALLVARARGWEGAGPLFARLAAMRAETGAETGAGTGATGTPPGAFLLRPRPPVPALDLAAPRAGRAARIPPELAARIVVYTACFGRDPDLPPLLDGRGGVRFLCFTDRAVAAPGWEILPAAFAAEGASPAALEAVHRIRAAEALAAAAPGAEFSLWLEPDTRPVGNLHTLVLRWLLDRDLVLWRHPTCIDWHDLAEHALLAGAEPAPVLGQARAAAAAGAPRDRGAVDTGLIWRRHDAAAVRALTEAWRAHEAEAPGAEAPIALYRALHGDGGGDGAPPRPAILPEGLGPAGRSLFHARAPRRRPRRHRAGPPAPGLARGRIPLAFLYHADHARTATTFLRGEQLSGMVARADPDRFDVLYTHDAASLRDRVVIVTKSALTTRGPEAIADLRRRNHLLIGSWDDIIPEPGHVAELDAHMTLSIRQTVALNRVYPDTPAFLVTHHVNPQVRAGRPPSDRLRTGYFGDLVNTTRPESLAGMIDLVGINTARVNDSWLDALPHYNCHWIVRRPRPWNGWKPFLKGFVAARCGAAVVVTRDEGDALHYLGDDYPFFAASLEPADLEMAMARVAGAFGGPDWRHALAIMEQVAARSSDAQVTAEFRAMIETLVG